LLDANFVFAVHLAAYYYDATLTFVEAIAFEVEETDFWVVAFGVGGRTLLVNLYGAVVARYASFRRNCAY
jgi:hypothetical protein